METDAPFPEPSFLYPFRVPSKVVLTRGFPRRAILPSPSRFPKGDTTETDARLQSLPLRFFQGPQLRCPPSGFQLPLTDAPFQEPFFICLSESPVNEPPSVFPSGAPMERAALFQIILLHISRVPN